MPRVVFWELWGALEGSLGILVAFLEPLGPLGQLSLFSDLSNLSAPEKISISPQRGAIFWRWRFERFSIFPDNGRLPFESEHIAAEGWHFGVLEMFMKMACKY